MVNTIIKSKKLKSIIDDIKKEQLDNKLTNIERLEDWEERFINQTEQLHQVEKDLKENIDKLEGAKDKLEKAKETYISVIANKLKEQEELEERIKALEEKNESQEIALLKEIHQRELKELQDTIELRKPIYRLALESASNSIEKIKELEKELEEKELLIEYLKTRVEEEEEKAECHLDALKVAKQWRERREDEIWEWADYLEEENQGLEQEIQQLKQQLYLANKSLPALPRKKNKLQQFTKKISEKIYLKKKQEQIIEVKPKEIKPTHTNSFFPKSFLISLIFKR
jgi:chromosome segregation ATPase